MEGRDTGFICDRVQGKLLANMLLDVNQRAVQLFQIMQTGSFLRYHHHHLFIIEMFPPACHSNLAPFAPHYAASRLSVPCGSSSYTSMFSAPDMEETYAGR